MTTVAVLCGGRSGEHDISVQSGRAVHDALLRSGYTAWMVLLERDGRWTFDDGALTVGCGAGFAELARRAPDVVFPALHGPLGEDGTLQGALDLMDLTYVGSGVAASGAAMDKPLAKRVFRGVGLPVAKEVVVEPDDWARDPDGICARALSELGLPIFVKPARLGSSVGVHRVDDAAELGPALEDCLRHNGTALAEEYLGGRELTAPVVEDPETGEPTALPLIEIRAIGHAFFDYTSKYTEGHNEELCPAPLPSEVAAGIADLALRAHRALGCRGMSRTDVILTERGPVLLETNTIPGLTSASLIPKSAAAAGMSFDAFIERLVRCALARPAR